MALFAVPWNLDDCVYEIPRSVTGILVVVIIFIIAIVCPAIVIVVRLSSFCNERVFIPTRCYAAFQPHRVYYKFQTGISSP